MVKKAYIDLEFKSTESGFDDIDKKINKLLDAVNKLSEASGKFSVNARTGGGGGGTKATVSRVKRYTGKVGVGDAPLGPIPFEKVSAFSNMIDKFNDKFIHSDKLTKFSESNRQSAYEFKIQKPLYNLTKLFLKLGGVGGAILLFTNLIKTIVSQSQVFQSIVQLVFHPFIMMVNFMLLPVLKWLIPNVSEWLQWTVDNKDALESVGDVLTVIGDTLKGFPTLENNPLKLLIETLTSFGNIDASDASVFEKWILKFQEGVGLITSVFDTLPVPTLSAGKLGEIVDGVFTAITDALINASVGDTFKEKLTLFGDSLKESISSALTDMVNSFVSAVGSIPLVGPSIQEFLNNSMNPNGTITNTTNSSNTTDLSILLLDAFNNQDNVTYVNPTMSSLLRGRMGMW